MASANVSANCGWAGLVINTGMDHYSSEVVGAAVAEFGEGNWLHSKPAKFETV